MQGLAVPPVFHRRQSVFLVFAVSACRKKRRAGIQVPRAHPEAVHEIIIRAEGRQFIQRGAANKNSQGNGVGKDFTYP